VNTPRRERHGFSYQEARDMESTDWNPGVEVERPEPNAQVVFTGGDYDHALRCYYRAREWVLNTGQCFRRDMEGIIRSPQHAESPSERTGFVPQELINKQGWSCTIDLYFAAPTALDFIKGLELPEDSRLVLVP
jgi:hypothetical protein